jgi:hypothetical protein
VKHLIITKPWEEAKKDIADAEGIFKTMIKPWKTST